MIIGEARHNIINPSAHIFANIRHVLIIAEKREEGRMEKLGRDEVRHDFLFRSGISKARRRIRKIGFLNITRFFLDFSWCP